MGLSPQLPDTRGCRHAVGCVHGIGAPFLTESRLARRGVGLVIFGRRSQVTGIPAGGLLFRLAIVVSVHWESTGRCPSVANATIPSPKDGGHGYSPHCVGRQRGPQHAKAVPE